LVTPVLKFQKQLFFGKTDPANFDLQRSAVLVLGSLLCHNTTVRGPDILPNVIVSG